RRKQLARTMSTIDDRCRLLTQQLRQGLDRIEGVRLYGPKRDEPRTSTIAFTLAGMASGEVALRLSEQGVFVSHGNFYAATVIERLGLGAEGLVRAGCACYTTSDEVNRLIDAVRQLA